MVGRRRKVRYTVPKLVNGRGTIPIDRSFKGVGRIRIVSGTTDETVYLKMMDTLDNIHDAGNVPTLEALRDGSVTMMEVYSNAIQKGVTSQMTVNLDTPLKETLTEWLKTHEVKDSTRRSYKQHLDLIYKVCTVTDVVRDLPKRLDTYRRSAIKRNIGTTFNRVRAVVMAFAKARYRDTSDFYLSIKQVPSVAIQRKGVGNVALPVTDIVTFTQGMNNKCVEMVWSMCTGGFRLGEYLEENDTTWNTTNDRLNIIKNNPGHGNKGYTRTVMLPFPVSKPTLGERQFRRHLETAVKKSGLKVSSHTFRKCFSHWMELSGIPRTRRKGYLGHGKSDITDIYEVHDVEKYLRDDAKDFRDFVEKHRNQIVNPKAREFFNLT